MSGSTEQPHVTKSQHMENSRMRFGIFLQTPEKEVKKNDDPSKGIVFSSASYNPAWRGLAEFMFLCAQVSEQFLSPSFTQPPITAFQHHFNHGSSPKWVQGALAEA